MGFDPHPSVIEIWGSNDSVKGLDSCIEKFMSLALEHDVRRTKLQVAFFERYGLAGLTALARLIGNLRQHGILVIGDTKRGDIKSSMSGYSEAWLKKGSDFEVDSMTVSPFHGVQSLEPIFDLANTFEKQIFVLAVSSNKEAWASQQAIRKDGISVAAGVIREVVDRTARQPNSGGNHGVVFGATAQPGDFGIDFSRFPEVPLLVPGFGFQGVDLSASGKLFPCSSSVTAVLSRSLLNKGPENFGDSLARARESLLA